MRSCFLPPVLLPLLCLLPPLRADVPGPYRTLPRLIWVVDDVDRAAAAWQKAGVPHDFQTADRSAQPRFLIRTARFANLRAHWIQPMTGASAFATFLKQRGPGVFSLFCLSGPVGRNHPRRKGPASICPSASKSWRKAYSNSAPAAAPHTSSSTPPRRARSSLVSSSTIPRLTPAPAPPVCPSHPVRAHRTQP